MALRSAIINVMARAAEKAGRALLRDFGELEQLQVSRKGPHDFVTNADHKAEKILLEELTRARPDFGVWAEESGEHHPGRSERWLIDPLDGTLNFLHGLPLWCVSLAAERDGEVIAGVIYEPVRDQMFWAERGVGAFVNHQRLRVSARKDLADALISVGVPLRGDLSPATDSALQKNLLDVVASSRRLGSTALNLAYVAAGRLDATLMRRVRPWDVAAGYLMVREAGGLISPLQPAANGSLLEAEMVLASNFTLHQTLQALITKHI